MGGEVCTAVDMMEEMGANVDVVVFAEETYDGGKVKMDNVEDTGRGIESKNCVRRGKATVEGG